MLDWEEGIFNGLKALWKKVTVAPRERRLATVRVHLEDQRKALFLLGCQLFERGPLIGSTDAHGN